MLLLLNALLDGIERRANTRLITIIPAPTPCEQIGLDLNGTLLLSRVAPSLTLNQVLR
jgi:hypothetical protein